MDHDALQVSRPGDLPAWVSVVEPGFGLVIGLLLVAGFAAHAVGGLAGMAWRLSCVACVAVCLKAGVDWRQAGALALIWLPFALSAAIAAAAAQPMAALADLARHLFIIGFGAIVFGAAHDTVARRVGFWALLVAAAAILAYSLLQTVPALASGWTYASARVLKGKSFQSGFNANEVCFAALIALLACYPERLVPRWVCLAMGALIGLCSGLLGARAPGMALFAGAVIGLVAATAPIWPACASRRWLGACVSAGLTAAFLAFFFSHIDAIAHSGFANQLAGRAALWQIAQASWAQQPLFGFGPGSFQAVIHANLGKAHFSTDDEFQSLYALQAGGFHNIWLSVLVERGVLGLAGLFASWCLLVGFALRHGGTMPWSRRVVLAALLAALFVRGQVELGGLFDDGDGPIDEIVMMTIALTFPQVPGRRATSLRARDLTAHAAAAQPANAGPAYR